MMNGMSPNNSPCLQINVFTANEYWLLALFKSIFYSTNIVKLISFRPLGLQKHVHYQVSVLAKTPPLHFLGIPIECPDTLRYIRVCLRLLTFRRETTKGLACRSTIHK